MLFSCEELQTLALEHGLRAQNKRKKAKGGPPAMRIEGKGTKQDLNE